MADENNGQDTLFLQAKKAAQLGQWDEFNNLKSQLQNYLLYPYLEYYTLNKDISMRSDLEIQNYISHNPNTPLAKQLLRNWLVTIAEKNNWQLFLKYYQATNDKILTCYYLRALQQTQQDSKAFAVINELWLVGTDQPGSCTAMFDTWLEKSVEKNKLIWARFELALKKYNFTLAHYLAAKLPETQKNEAEAIIKLYDNPTLVTQAAYLKQQHSAEVLSYGIARLARRDPTGAINSYEKLSKQYQFNVAQQQRIFQAIALKFAMRKNPAATIWFRKLVGFNLDALHQEWLVRTAIYNNDWKLVRDSIAAFPQQERESARWQYWYACALNQLNEKEKAHEIFNQLANDRSYHGFLASYKYKKSLRFNHQLPTVNAVDKNGVLQLLGFQRAKLLYQLKQYPEARAELKNLMYLVNPAQQYILMNEVANWGWTNEALRLSNQANYQDDINIRFPLTYKDIVIANASQRKIDPALIYAIIRQESMFAVTANSPAGAVGLMQLMPGTAYKTSKQFKLSYKNSADLFNDKINIEFGTAHLKQLALEFNNNPILMIAAYNAGKEAVYRWLPHGKVIPADVWIETIPFNETRNYLKNVVAYYLVYQERLQQLPNVDKIMQNIKPRK